MLADAARIQEHDCAFINKMNKRRGIHQPDVYPTYSEQDAERCMRQFVNIGYDRPIPVVPGVTLTFYDAGHILGAAQVCLDIEDREDGRKKRFLFSGDVGRGDNELLRDPVPVPDVDILLMESTYGGRFHEAPSRDDETFCRAIKEALELGGRVYIPAFAVERTQQLLYLLNRAYHEGTLPLLPVYVDSPLAVEATNVFCDSYSDFDDEAASLIENGINPIAFPNLYVSVTSEESKAINSDPAPKVIISASGMCEAGRIRHHLKHNLWRPECTILFVGYQAVGTLGRAITDGATDVKLFDEKIHISAEIEQLHGISGHADNEGLLKWMKSFKAPPKHVFVNHGEDTVCEIYAARLRDELGLSASAPYNGEEYSLTENKVLVEGNREKIVKNTASQNSSRRVSTVYERLLSAQKRLQTVVAHNEGGANKDLAKFADQIIALCEKWDR